MRSYVRWLLIDPRFVWVTVAGICVGLAVPLWCGSSEKAIRLSGLFLQLGGIITVAWGIVSTRQFFALPRIRDSLRSWWRRAPFRRLPTGHGAGSINLPSISGEGHGYTSLPIDHSAPVDERIRSLERNITLLHERISSVHSHARKKHDDLTATVSGHAARLEEVRTKLATDLRGFGTSGLHISAIGAAWLFVGSIMGSASPELAAWVR